MESNDRRMCRAHVKKLGAMSKQIHDAFLFVAWGAISPAFLDEVWWIYEDFDLQEE
jgi:hypothetical protein